MHDPLWTNQDIIHGLQAFYITVDQVITGVTSRVELPCKKGCSHCCKDVPPPLSPSEWKVILEYLRNLPAEVRQKAITKALAIYGQFQEQIDALETAQDQFDALSKNMNFECPFLLDEACSIYPARPHACRLYGNSFIPAHNKMFACHLVEEALLDQEHALVNFEGTLAMLRLYPETTQAQVFPWYVAHDLPPDLSPI